MKITQKFVFLPFEQVKRCQSVQEPEKNTFLFTTCCLINCEEYNHIISTAGPEQLLPNVAGAITKSHLSLLD